MSVDLKEFYDVETAVSAAYGCRPRVKVHQHEDTGRGLRPRRSLTKRVAEETAKTAPDLLWVSDGGARKIAKRLKIKGGRKNYGNPPFGDKADEACDWWSVRARARGRRHGVTPLAGLAEAIQVERNPPDFISEEEFKERRYEENPCGGYDSNPPRRTRHSTTPPGGWDPEMKIPLCVTCAETVQHDEWGREIPTLSGATGKPWRPRRPGEPCGAYECWGPPFRAAERRRRRELTEEDYRHLRRTFERIRRGERHRYSHQLAGALGKRSDPERPSEVTMTSIGYVEVFADGDVVGVGDTRLDGADVFEARRRLAE